MPTETPELSLRPASEDDAALLREWRNDPETRAASRSTAEVGTGEHAAWLAAVLADPARQLLVCELEGEPAGQVRFDRLDERSYEISISLAPAARGQGLSPSFISLAVKRLRESHRDARVEAHVREENTRSLAAFRGAGFRPSGERADGFLVLVATLARPVGAPTLDFFVVGAAKAGTTALHHLLRTHPGLCLPEGKELPYFVTPKHAYYESPAEFFADAFGHRAEGQLCGTVTPQYLYGALLGPDRLAAASDSPETTIPSRIRDAYPGAKLIAILRDPVARARSHHRMSVMRGIEQRSFDRAIEELLAPEALAESRLRPDETNGYVVLGEYGRLLGGYLEVFPREQLLVLFQGDLEEDPGAVCAEVFAFLGVDPGFRPPNLGSRYHDGGSHRRFAWLDLTSWQRAARRSALLSGLWQRVPRSQRRRVLKRFNLASRRLFLWNRVAVDTAAEPDAPSPETLARLRAHYREDEARLRDLLGAPPPWA